MAVYAIGDIQGCHLPLQRLLAAMSFDARKDLLWFVGDLVNRGPHSLEVLRLVRSMGSSAVVVLGNHDLTLLAVAEGVVEPQPKYTFGDVLDAPDADGLLEWLRHRPVLHHDASLGFTMVHAGIAPQWDLDQALSCAADLEYTLRGAGYRRFLAHMFGNQPARWRTDLSGLDRLRFITNCFTRMRYCDLGGALNFDYKGPPGSQPQGLTPWFRVPGRRNRDLNIIFGHWGALGYYREPGIIALETGCAWGKQLVSVRLDSDEPPHTVDCGAYIKPPVR